MARSRRKSSAAGPTTRLRQRLLGKQGKPKPATRRRSLRTELLEDRRLLSAHPYFVDTFDSPSSISNWAAGDEENINLGGGSSRFPETASVSGLNKALTTKSMAANDWTSAKLSFSFTSSDFDGWIDLLPESDDDLLVQGKTTANAH